jgi:hypothetical protein
MQKVRSVGAYVYYVYFWSRECWGVNVWETGFGRHTSSLYQAYLSIWWPVQNFWGFQRIPLEVHLDWSCFSWGCRGSGCLLPAFRCTDISDSLEPFAPVSRGTSAAAREPVHTYDRARVLWTHRRTNRHSARSRFSFSCCSFFLVSRKITQFISSALYSEYHPEIKRKR